MLAALYGDDRLLALTLGVAYLPVAFSLQAPQWVFFRRMDFLRLRLLQVIVPLGTVLVTVPLLLAGVGVWALVIGPFCGHAAAVAAAWRASPYRLRPRFERAAARRYLRFSWPVFATAVAALAVAQGQVALFGLSEDGLAAAGWITLAATLTRYADRADQIVATTIYPAIVRVRDRTAVLEELFAKSNRLTLMWAFPFGAGLALFGGDLVAFVLGDEWEPAVVLLGGLAVATALQQLGYNWFAFYRARGESRPQAVESAAFAGSFALLAVPATLAWGSWGFVAGRLACTVCVLAVRRAYVLRLMPGVRLGEIAARAALPGAARDGARARRCGSRSGAASGRWRRRSGSWRCGSPGSCWPRTGWSPACCGSCGATCGPAASGPSWDARGGGPLVSAVTRGAPAGRALRLRPALLWLAAALISGFTMRRYLEPFDEGLLMQARRRGSSTASGPTRTSAGPTGRGSRSSSRGCRGCSTRRWRGGGWLRVAADATAALAVWGLVRREAGERWALAAWLAAAVTVAQPTSANPFPVALALALCAVLAAARGRPVVAGLLVALAAFWRPDLGVAWRRRRGAWRRCSPAARRRGGARGRAARGRNRAARGRRCSTSRSRSRRAPGGCGTSSSASRPATATCGGCRSRSPTTARCAAGRRRRWPRTSRTCSASTCRWRRSCSAPRLLAGPPPAAACARRRSVWVSPALAGVLVLRAGCAPLPALAARRPARAAAGRVPVRGDPARGRRARRSARCAACSRPGSP